MLKSLVSSLMAVAAVIALSPVAHADPSALLTMSMPTINAAVIQAQVGTLGLKWKVGDTADYSMDAGFISGTIHEFVRDDNGTEIWVQEDVDLGFAGKQKVEILFDKATGQIKKLLADGKEQTLPDSSNLEVVDQKEDQVTVPAGTFQAIYVKIKNKDDGKIQEAWINPQEVPINGMVKALADSQFGQVKQELTSKSFAP
jgi:hypothetical protein